MCMNLGDLSEDVQSIVCQCYIHQQKTGENLLRIPPDDSYRKSCDQQEHER